MKSLFVYLFVISTILGCSASPPDTSQNGISVGVDVPLKNASFNPDTNGQIADWSAVEHSQGKSYSFTLDDKVVYSGTHSARIQRYGSEIYGMLDQNVRISPDWVGKTARLSGALKVEKADGGGGALILQATAGDGSISTWNHMQENRAKNTLDWKIYSVDIKVPGNAYFLRVGVMLEDGGTLWADDLKLTIIN